MHKELIILSDNFGTSFSGGCTATANFVRFWRGEYDTIHVICKQTDGHLKDDIILWKYNGDESLNRILSELTLKPVIGYGDFHTAVHFIDHNIPFYFTYHDNFPELKNIIPSNPECKKMMESYKRIFSHAEFIFSVSNQKVNFISSYTNKFKVVRNGISQPVTKQKRLNIIEDEPIRILMAGNVTERKYRNAIKLFELIDRNNDQNIEVDIFGSCQDSEIWSDLAKFKFVNIKPFQDMISYEGYHIYLNTSTMENLSLSVVDALKNSTPVLAFNVGGLKEVVDNRNGILVAPYNIAEMKSSIHIMRDSIANYNFEDSRLDEFDWEKSAISMLEIMTSNVWT